MPKHSAERSFRLTALDSENHSAGVLPGVTQVTIGEEDDLAQLVVVGLDGEAVSHAHVLTAHIVDRRTVCQLQDRVAD